MKIERSFELKHPRELVWSRMTDVYFVAQCLPGASIVEELGDNRYIGRMSVKVGPMTACFDDEITIKANRRIGVPSFQGKALMRARVPVRAER